MDAALHAEPIRPIKRQEYDKLVEFGAFIDEKVELLEGFIVQMSPQKPLHATTVRRLMVLLVKLFEITNRAQVRNQSSFAATDESEPEPDFAVVPNGDYTSAHPAKAHLIVEVSDSTLRRDRGVKAAVYAEAGVPEYWVVNLSNGVVEVYTDIVAGRYARITPFHPGESITLRDFPDVSIAVNEVLG